MYVYLPLILSMYTCHFFFETMYTYHLKLSPTDPIIFIYMYTLYLFK